MWCSMCPFLADCEDPAQLGGGCDCDGADDFGGDPLDYIDDEQILKPNTHTQGETMNENAIQELINDAHKLAKADLAPDLIQPCVETLALRLERLVQKREEDPTGFAQYLAVPALGIQFRRHKSASMTKLIATWRDHANDHVYEVLVRRDGDSADCGWRALATNDGRLVFTLTAKGRSNCEHMALSAMKRYLKNGHRKTYRSLAKAAEPLSPEAVLAATVKRQKEGC